MAGRYAGFRRNEMNVVYVLNAVLSAEELVSLFRAVEWSSAEHPEALEQAMRNSHKVVSAWADDELIGLANSISDGFMAAYVPYVAVRPEWQGKGVGREMMRRLLAEYESFPRVALIAYDEAAGFYERCGMSRGKGKLPMYTGTLPS